MSRTYTNEVYIVFYDITSNKLRRKIEKKLCDYGVRIQYSVFMVTITLKSYVDMTNALLKIMDRHPALQEDTDSILSMRLQNSSACSCIFGTNQIRDQAYMVIG